MKSIVDPENSCIYKFLRGCAVGLPENAKVLDAGAGKRPYKKLFQHCCYESCDIDSGFYEQKHDFYCSLDSIPKANGEYHAIVLSQVLEHVPNPRQVMKELARVCQQGGKLFLTVPMNGPLHAEPWHFFHFTHYGIERIATESGWKVERAFKIGGLFWFLGKRLRFFPSDLMRSIDPFRARKRGQSVWRALALTILLTPVWGAAKIIFTGIISPACYWLDGLDFGKKITSGWMFILIRH